MIELHLLLRIDQKIGLEKLTTNMHRILFRCLNLEERTSIGVSILIRRGGPLQQRSASQTRFDDFPILMKTNQILEAS